MIEMEMWAVVEVMGHKRFAGFVTEQTVAGSAFVRVDVPEVQVDAGGQTLPAFTKLLGASSIYALTHAPRRRPERSPPRCKSERLRPTKRHD
jgi:hypothetical protein